MNKRTKACAISQATKEKVWERDNGCCVYCGSTQASPCCHFIARSQGGLGVEKNILTLCQSCHTRFDQTPYRPFMKIFFEQYLKEKYDDWCIYDIIYKKP